MIFGHRNVRRMLDSLIPVIESERLKTLENDLAWNQSQGRAAEWEIAIGFGLQQVGKLGDLGTQRSGNPDFLWTPYEHPIIVEVTCISDSHLHKNNPVEEFSSRLRSVAKKQSLPGHFSYELGETENGGAVILAIPSKQEFDAFFKKSDFLEFLQKIKKSPLEEHTYTFEARGASSKIIYRSQSVSGTFTSSSYRSYTLPQTYQHSSVINALRGKEDQIRKSGLAHPAILFICDNDCDALTRTVSRIGCVSMKDIIGLFLNGQEKRMLGDLVWQEGVKAKGRRIHAVVWIAVEQAHQVLSRPTTRLRAEIEYANYADPYLRTPEFVSAINKAFTHFPLPQSTPRNANTPRRYPRFYGGYTMTNQSLKFSALTLQKLLAGEISYEEFARDHPDLVEHFQRLNSQGLMIDAAMLEKCDHEDDDWISFQFGGLNPEKLFKKSKS